MRKIFSEATGFAGGSSLSRVNIESETERWKQDNAQTGNGG
jgi:hypothetical protein